MHIWPLIIITKVPPPTLTPGSLFTGSCGSWDQIMGMAVLGAFFMFLLFFLRRAFIQGMAATGMEE